MEKKMLKYGFKDGEFSLWLEKFYLVMMVEETGAFHITDL